MRLAFLSLPLLIAGCFGIVAPAIARRLPPRDATWLLSAGGTLAALNALAVLLLLASVIVGQQPDIARAGHWSVSALRAHAPVDLEVEIAALIVAITVGVASVVVAWRRARAMRAAYRTCRHLAPATGELIVVPDATVNAYAVPGWPGRIVVGQALLAALSSKERHAVLAHERAHLAHGHHWHLAVVTIAATLNPLLAPLRRAAELAVERWADETAAEQVGDRRTVAAALSRAALLDSAARSPSATLSAASHHVPLRVAALLATPPRPRPVLVALSLILLLIGAAAAVVAVKETEHLFELAIHIQLAHIR